MAVYVGTLTVSAGVALASPTAEEITLEQGQLLLLRLYIPPGPRGEVYLRFLHRGVQLLPARHGTWWRPDNLVIDYPFQPGYPVPSGDIVFSLEGASPTANYPHSIIFECHILPPEQGTAPTVSTFQKLQNLVTRGGR